MDKYRDIIIETHTIVSELKDQNAKLFEKIDGESGVNRRLTRVETNQNNCLMKQGLDKGSVYQKSSNTIALISVGIILLGLFISPIWSKYIEGL